MEQTFLKRIRVLSFAVALFAVILVAKLYLVQIVQGSLFSERANRQYVKPEQTLFDRGTIYFESKDGTRIAAATIKEGYTVAIVPREMENPEIAYDVISKIIPLDREVFMSRARKENDPYEEVARRVEVEKGVLIDSLNIPGVRIYKERWRVYPGGSLASHAIGFMGFQGDELAGRYGLERSYESTLSRDTKSLYVNFFAEIFANIKKASVSNLEGDIITTIEPSVETFVEKKIAELSARYSAESVGAIVINPRSGAIKAMASYPTFDSNNFKNEKSSAIFSNPLVENVFEMGSIVKPLTMAAGIDSGAVTAKTTYNDEGYLIIDDKRIANFDGVGRGVVNMQRVLSDSLNTGVAFVVRKMGKDRFADTMLNFGLGEQTGIDLPNEAKGLVENLKTRRDIEVATASYGQGIAVSPVGMVRALSALANGGALSEPHLVKEIEYTLGFSKDARKKSGRQVIKKETAEEVTRMLIEAVDTALAGGRVKMDRWSIAAKTGTAQIPDPENGGYYSDRFLHSFFGYFPAYSPQFLVFLYMRNPKGAGFASETLVSPFIDIAKFLINYYEIPPDR